ncbi:mRNA capping enzyme family protein [Trichophyton interdigitale]|uniref:mRNA capping enzyme family protein n=1 Tax=Trichophyton interdigitale TaxID=101480 RepID=A0A9P4YM26_9EURO|nr:mRNA capping enzyme family protein [Trichophyton interdigitale]KAF3899826.1 mRNA capping enzyme family protein [Trichophyton interdigitale]
MMASPEKKSYLDKRDFEQGLKALDEEMGKNEMIAAFAPIRMITAGGFLAVMYLQSRNSTGDLDYLLEPEWAKDPDIQRPLKEAIFRTGERLFFDTEWANEDVALFVTSSTREELFRKAEEQNIVLFKGENLVLLAAPMEWAVERKIRRIYAVDRGRKAEFDMNDCLAMLKCLRERQDGLLDREYIRTLNVNSFDVLPDHEVMELIATTYRDKYHEEIFG